MGFGLGFGGRCEKSPGLVAERRLGLLRLGAGINGVQRIAFNQLGEKPPEGLRAAESLQAHHLAVDGKHRPHLVLHASEGLQVAVQIPLVANENLVGGHGGRVHVHPLGLFGHLVPDPALVAAIAGPFPETETHALLGRPPQRAVHHLGPGGKLLRAGVPAALLNAGDRDHQFGACGHQDGDVDHPVLLGAHQLLALDDEHRPLGAVHQA
jgi:hypothetical protein